MPIDNIKVALDFEKPVIDLEVQNATVGVFQAVQVDHPVCFKAGRGVVCCFFFTKKRQEVILSFQAPGAN